MEKFNWSKGVGFGALIWVIMFAFVWLLMSLALYGGVISKIIVVIAAGVLSYLFAMNIELMKPFQAFNYGLTWVIVGVVLDLLISVQFKADLFSQWEYWLSYAFILFIPIIYSMTGETKSSKMSTAH